MARGNIPNALIDAELYINGSNSLAGIAEVELPDVEYATVTNEQFGLTAEIETPLIGHFKKLETKIKLDCVDKSLLNFNNLEPILIEIKGAKQSTSRATHGAVVEGIDATFKGMIKKMSGLKTKPGSKLETDFAMSVTYYKLEIGGKVIVEIDVLNNVNYVNGSSNNLVRRFLGLK